MWSFVVDKFVTEEAAFLNISDLALQRGYGIFDFFKVKGQHAFFIEDHLDRFFNSARIMKLAMPHSRNELRSIIATLTEKNALGQSGIKMILTGGYSEDGYTPARPNLLLTQHSLTLTSTDQIAEGVSIITYPYSREFPEAKTINYSMGIWILDHLKIAGAADVLYFQGETVSEFPRCNIFIVTHDDVILTPGDRILNGITRKNIIKLGAANQYVIREANVTRNEVYEAKEVFLTSTTKRIVPVKSVDGRIIGAGMAGTITQRLFKDLLFLEEQDLQKVK
ncbi:MAG: aminotransferase class IV [Chryseolinea sp.]